MYNGLLRTPRTFVVYFFVVFLNFSVLSQEDQKNYTEQNGKELWQPEEKIYNPNSSIEQHADQEIPILIDTYTQKVKIDSSKQNTEPLSNNVDSTLITEAIGTFSATANSSDYTVTATWANYTNPCALFPSSGYSWHATYYFGAVHATEGSGTSPGDGSVTSYPGPNRTIWFDYEFCYSGTFCNGCYPVVNANAATAALKPPTNFTASDNGSFQEVSLSWSKGTDIPNYHPDTGARIVRYYIYRNGAYIATTENLSYTATVTPGQTDTWGVRTHTNYVSPTTSTMVTDAGSTLPLEASDGEYNGRVKISWANLSHIADEIKIKRGNDELGILSANSTTFYDDNAIPGKISVYSVIPINSAGQDLLEGTELGYARADGRIDGNVATRQNAGVSDVEISVISTDPNISNCLEFDGVNDYVQVDSEVIPSSGNFTVSVWAKDPTMQTGNVEILSQNAGSGEDFYIGKATNGNIRAGDDWSDTGVSFPSDGLWHYYTVVKDSFNTYLYLDGIQAASLGSPIVNPAGSQFRMARQYGGHAEYFNGLVDDLRVWSVARDSSQIVSDMFTQLNGNEQALVSYWTFNDSNRSSALIAGDYAEGGGNHGTIYGALYQSDSSFVKSRGYTDVNGDYLIKNIYYDESREFRISPFKLNHGFNPGFRNRTLEENTPTASSVTFTDTTAFTIKGRIVQVFVGDTCFVPEVELLIDDVFLLNKTNADGEFQITIEEPGIYTIKPRYENHTFSPSEYTVTIEDDYFGMDFIDTKMDTLSGEFLASCNIYIGRADLRIWNDNNPAQSIDTTIISNNISGYYEIVLPARTYNIEMTDFTPSDPTIVNSLDVLAYFSAPFAIDLTTDNVLKNFIYRKPPSIKISGFDEFTCAPFAVVPIMEMGVIYPLTIEVYENFNLDTCLADTGYLLIYDGIGGDPSDPDTFMLDSGAVLYNMMAGFPNILDGGQHPFQKNFQIVAVVEGQSVDSVQYVLVEGNQPRTATFVSTSPEIPFNILRDPPGDGSYSYLSQGTTTNHAWKLSALVSGSLNIWAELTLGAEFEKGTPFFSSGTKVWGKFKETFDIGASFLSQTEFNLSITNTDKFQTSGNPDITGADGDVFVGAAMNLIYALTDVIEWDADSCKVDQDVTIIVDNDGFATTFMYTEEHIENTLVPQLEEIRDIYLATNSDSANIYINQIDVWNQTLALNDSLKEEAIFVENRSFSAGAQYESTTEVTKTFTQSIEFTLWIERSFAIEAGFEESGSGLAGGAGITLRNEFGAGYTFAHTWTTTTGFVLDDDDVGDFFSVDIKHDETYGTPVFDLVSGRSSCPWEPGSQPRDGVSIQIDPYIQNNVPPNDPAVFSLSLGNTSQSGETRTYNLSVDQTSNFNGAIIRVGGVVISDYLSYTIPAFQQITATMAVEKGPLAYSYPDLRLEFASACDGSIDTSVTFSVNYQSPCSNVNLFRPYDNWLVNQASNDSLQIIIRDYDKNNPNLISLGLEYRKIGEGWNTAFNILKADLPVDYINMFWDVSSLSDGDYELRAVSECGLVGMNYSAIASGTIIRNNLMVFGTPQPSDGILHLGEDISVAFTGDLDCGRIISEGQVTLTQLSNSIQVPINMACIGNSLVLTPIDSISNYENETLRARVANIYDLSGNRLNDPVEWQFVVNMNPVYWLSSNTTATIYQNNQASVSGDLTNAHGAESKSFTITDYQPWLTPDITTGQIPPGGNQSINFSISDQLNPGSYSDTVYAETTDGTESFIIQVTVLSQPPDWSVNPANYQYSMNITAEVEVNGAVAEDELDVISAFVGNEARGVANFQYESTIDGYLAFITIYSNSTSGEEISFRFWDASVDIEYGGAEENVLFTNNSTVGTLLNPLTIHPTGIAQTISLNSGWTWISTNVENTDMSVESVLDFINPANGDMIKGQSSFSQYVGGNGWLGTLNEIEIGESYQIILTNSEDLWNTGTPADLATTSVDYEAGWTWIGYLPRENILINTALANMNATHGDRIKSQTEYAEYDGSSQSWIGSMQYMNPGEGYLLNTVEAGSFTYSDGTSQYPKRGNKNPSTYSPISGSMLLSSIPEWQIKPSDYEFTMNMIGVLNIRGVESVDSLDIIAAFVNDTCRGFTQPVYIAEMNRYEVFMTIYSNSTTGETIDFRIYDADRDEIIAADVNAIFTADDLNGSVQQPFVFEVEDLNAPGLESAFHFSTEAGLARYIKLFVSSNESLAGNPQVEIINSYSTQHYSTQLFDVEENIYVIDYYVEDLGESNYIISANDFAGNTATDTINLNVQSTSKITATSFAINDMLNVTMPGNTSQNKGYLFAQRIKIRDELISLEQIGEVYEFRASEKLHNGLHLQFDLKGVKSNDEDIRKVGLYIFNEENDEWEFVAGATDKYILSATIAELGRYGIFYDEHYVAIPMEFRVHQNYPNPFNPNTTIKFDLPETEKVILTIFNVLGQRIKTVVSKDFEAGYHKTVWKGRNEKGENVGSGIYFYQLKAGKNVINKKMILIR